MKNDIAEISGIPEYMQADFDAALSNFLSGWYTRAAKFEIAVRHRKTILEIERAALELSSGLEALDDDLFDYLNSSCPPSGGKYYPGDDEPPDLKRRDDANMLADGSSLLNCIGHLNKLVSTTLHAAARKNLNEEMEPGGPLLYLTERSAAETCPRLLVFTY